MGMRLNPAFEVSPSVARLHDVVELQPQSNGGSIGLKESDEDC